MPVSNKFIADFLGKTKTKEELTKEFMNMGIPLSEAQARAEMQLYAKERYKMSNTDIVGEIPEKDIVVKIVFNTKDEAEFLLSMFPINEQLNAIIGKKIIDFIKSRREIKWKDVNGTKKEIKQIPPQPVGLGAWVK